MRACRFFLHRSRLPRVLDQVGGPAAARELAIREVVDLAADQGPVEMGMAGVSGRALGLTYPHRLRIGAKRSWPRRRRTIRGLPPPASSARAVAAISGLTDRRAVAATQVVQGNRLVSGNRVSGNRVSGNRVSGNRMVSGNRATGWLVALVARVVALVARAVALVARLVALAARAVALVARAVALAARAVALVARAVALVARPVASAALAWPPVRWGGRAVRRVRGAVRWVRAAVRRVRAAVGCGKRWVGAQPEHFRQRRPGERVG